MNKRVAVVLVLASLVACKKKAALSGDDVIDVMGGFRDEMCLCKDRACADSVQDHFNRWASEQAGRMTDKPSEAQIKRMTEVSSAYGTCLGARMGEQPVVTPVPEQPTMSDASATNADVAIKQLYDGLGTEHVVTRLELSYIRADGTIDATYGRVEADLGKPKRPSPADDPNRPIGAPVPPDEQLTEDLMARCPQHVWAGGKRTQGETSCGILGEPLARPRCNVLAVWKQAIAAGAPAAGLATISLRSDGWTFTIDDAPRGIHFEHTFPDTCAPMLEKP